MSTTLSTTATSTDRKKTLLFGGSFDPVHSGHLYIVSKAIELTDYQRIVVMPTSVSNFKPGSRPASGADRLAMLRLAFDDFDSRGRELVISGWEVAKGGVSYTLETVKAMYSLFPVEGTLGFLMGDDLLEGLERWYGYGELVKLVHFVCLTRGGAVAHPAGACVEFLSVAPLRASSTAVRSGEEGEGLEKVRAYIEEHGLYYAGRNREGG